MTKYFINDKGEYLGGFDCDPEFYPQGQEVCCSPNHVLEVWNGKEWVMPVSIKNELIKKQRAERYRLEAEPYTQRLLIGEVTKEFVQAIRDKIKQELPYEVE